MEPDGFFEYLRNVLDPSQGRGIFALPGVLKDVGQAIQRRPAHELTSLGAPERHAQGTQLIEQGHPVVGRGMQLMAAAEPTLDLAGMGLPASALAGAVARRLLSRGAPETVETVLRALPTPQVGEEMLRVRHYGPGAKADVLEVGRQGTSRMAGRERARPNRLGRSHFYVGDAPAERGLAGQPMVETEFPAHLYLQGPEQAGPFFDAARGIADNPADVADVAEELMAAQGFEGYTDGAGTLVSFTDTPLTDTGRRRTAQIAAHFANPESRGSTFNLAGENLAGQDLYAVALRPGDDEVVDALTPQALADFEEKFAEDLAQPGASVGTWERDDGKVVLDVVEAIPDRETAIARGRERGQEGIFHLGGEGYIPTPAIEDDPALAMARQIESRAANQRAFGPGSLRAPAVRANGQVLEGETHARALLDAGFDPGAPQPDDFAWGYVDHDGNFIPDDDVAEAFGDMATSEQLRMEGIIGPRPVEAPAVVSQPSRRDVFDTSTEGLTGEFIETAQGPVERKVPGPRVDLSGLEAVMTPANERRIMDMAEAGAEQNRGLLWYATRPLREEMRGILGREEGTSAFNEFMRRIAGSSMLSAVDKNIARASGFQVANRQGVPYEAIDWPKGFGHLSNKSHSLQQALVDLDQLFRGDKIGSFDPNLRGNLDPYTIDTHIASLSGLPGGKIPDANRYGRAEEWLAGLADQQGFPSHGQHQSSVWLSPENMDRLAPGSDKPFLGVLNAVINQAAARRGVAPRQAFEDFVRGLAPLF